MYHVVTFHELHEVSYLVNTENLDELISKIDHQFDPIDSNKLSAKLVEVSTELSKNDAFKIASNLNYSKMKETHDR